MRIDRRLFLQQGAAAASASGWALAATKAGARQLRAAYIHDSQRHAAANKAGRNYWPAYVPEILSELGLRATQLTPEALRDGKQLNNYSTLLVSDLGAGADQLEKWVRDGGVLVAFGTEGVDQLCGNRHMGQLPQPVDEFTCAATFALADDPITAGIHSYLEPKQRLLIFSEVRKMKPEQSVELARLYDAEGADTGCAAITMRRLGRGRVFYFGFSVPQTMWALHQGRPIDQDRDGDGWLRRSDAIVRRPHSPEVAYADELLFLIANMVGTQPHAFIHQLPPKLQQGESIIPDALFFWGGDDEGDVKGIQITASNWMKEKGLPYHVNAMPRKDGKFGLSLEDAKKILANGHELAIHFNFIDNYKRGMGFTREDILSQAAAFRQYFNREQVCSVLHWGRWTGWAEPAKWMREAGVRCDNSFPAVGSPPSNNVDKVGFSFGGAFPFWYYDDYRGGNAKIDFLAQPITAYECGYIGEKTDFPTLRKAIDLAAHYHLPMNTFYHPIYIATYPACRAAIEEGLRYIRERKIEALHLGPDALYRWWKARSETQVGPVSVAGDLLSVEVESEYPAGVVVKIPLGKRVLRSVSINGSETKAGIKTQQMFGQNWGLIWAPTGKTKLSVRLTRERT